MTSPAQRRSPLSAGMALGVRLGWGVMAVLAGCASPGPPRSPSLQLPQPVTDLTAVRRGDVVTLQFTLPTRSTDKTFLKPQELHGLLCRQVRPDPACVPVAGLAETLAAVAGKSKGAALGVARRVTVQDALPPALAAGRPRLLAYRVEFLGPLGTSAGRSDAAFTAAGLPPQPVAGLHATGSREGIVLGWQAAPAGANDIVVLARERAAGEGAPHAAANPAASHRSRRPVATPLASAGVEDGQADLLEAHFDATSGSAPETLDTTALADTPYRYRAYRQRAVPVGGQTVVVRSAESSPVAITLRAEYAPAAPAELRAAGFANPAGAATGFVVSLIWQPVEDPGVTGYNVYRQTLDPAEQPVGGRVRLNAAPVPAPAFDDPTAEPARRYRYSVTAIDGHGNESQAATVVEEPAS